MHHLVLVKTKKVVVTLEGQNATSEFSIFYSNSDHESQKKNIWTHDQLKGIIAKLRFLCQVKIFPRKYTENIREIRLISFRSLTV